MQFNFFVYWYTHFNHIWSWTCAELTWWNCLIFRSLPTRYIIYIMIIARYIFFGTPDTFYPRYFFRYSRCDTWYDGHPILFSTLPNIYYTKYLYSKMTFLGNFYTIETNYSIIISHIRTTDIQILYHQRII